MKVVAAILAIATFILACCVGMMAARERALEEVRRQRQPVYPDCICENCGAVLTGTNTVCKPLPCAATTNRP